MAKELPEEGRTERTERHAPHGAHGGISPVVRREAAFFNGAFPTTRTMKRHSGGRRTGTPADIVRRAFCTAFRPPSECALQRRQADQARTSARHPESRQARRFAITNVAHGAYGSGRNACRVRQRNAETTAPRVTSGVSSRIGGRRLQARCVTLVGLLMEEKVALLCRQVHVHARQRLELVQAAE